MNRHEGKSSALGVPSDEKTGNGSHGLKERKRQRRTTDPERIEREAVRAVITPEAFAELERLRTESVPEDGSQEPFWRTARQRMVEMAKQRPDSAVKIMKAKVGAVGAMLGLPARLIDKLVLQVVLPQFVSAALANRAIQQFQKEPRFQDLWTEEKLRTNPPIRFEFAHAIVLGCINDAGGIAKSKNWGKLLALRPLEVDDWLYPRNISYLLKSTSRLRMRWEFRDTFKNILGDKRALVGEVMRSTKGDFLKHLRASDAASLRSRLDLMPDQFWRMVRCGEQFGPDGISAFVQELEEKTKGYLLPFPEPSGPLVQIQPMMPPGSSSSAANDFEHRMAS